MNDLGLTLDLPVAKGNHAAILCVDDEPRILSALTRTLGHEAYDVLRASDGEEALELLESSPVKVVIADQRMPGMSGSELLSEIRRRWPLVGRIILTGYPGHAVMIRSLEAEVDFLLTKPWDDGKLRRAVRRLIEEIDRCFRIRDKGVAGSEGDPGGQGG